MAACELLGAAVAALINVCAVAAPPESAPQITDRPLFQRSDSQVESAPPREQEPVRTAPLPPSALMGIGIIGGLMLTAAIRRRKQ